MKVEAAFSKLSEADIIALPVAPEVENETVITPVPASAAPIEQGAAHLGRSAPDFLWKYLDGSGNLLFAVARWNGPTGQKAKVLPVSWIRDASGGERFGFRHHPAPRPLYGLPELRERPNASIVVVEGEKCADAAKAVFPSSCHVTRGIERRAAGGLDAPRWPEACSNLAGPRCSRDKVCNHGGQDPW
jgi:hypothetical protein